MVKLLVQRKADVTARTDDGLTPLGANLKRSRDLEFMKKMSEHVNPIIAYLRSIGAPE
jgi:hypothetical protein